MTNTISIVQLRRIIREELIRGVPDHQFRSVVRSYAESVKQLMRRHIMLDKSRTSLERQQALNGAAKVLRELEEETFELLRDKLEEFILKSGQ